MSHHGRSASSSSSPSPSFLVQYRTPQVWNSWNPSILSMSIIHVWFNIIKQIGKRRCGRQVSLIWLHALPHTASHPLSTNDPAPTIVMWILLYCVTLRSTHPQQYSQCNSLSWHSSNTMPSMWSNRWPQGQEQREESCLLTTFSSATWKTIAVSHWSILVQRVHVHVRFILDGACSTSLSN